MLREDAKYRTAWLANAIEEHTDDDDRRTLEAAIDVLVHLHETPAPDRLPLPGGGAWPLLTYDILALKTGADLFPVWQPAHNPTVKIDDEAIRYMSLCAPVASELRLVIVGMKASHDLERVGDEATSIARRAIRLSPEPVLKPYIDIPNMAGIAVDMLRDALDCFLHGDTEKALAVCRRDSEVDLLNKQLYRELSSFMIENPATTSRALELMFISKSIERIADHATNIAEETIYLSQGLDVRHTEAVKKNAGAGTPE